MDVTQMATVVGSIIVPVAGVWIAIRKLKQAEELDREKEEKLKSEMASKAHADTAEAAKQLRAEIWGELRGVKDDNRRLREENSELREKYVQLETKYQLLESQMLMKIALLESAHNDLPIPQWLKDERGIVLSINKAYVDVFLKPRGRQAADYVGKTDFEQWPREVAVKFQENDTYVRESGQIWIGKEIVPDKHNNPIEWQIAKYPRKVGNVVIGIAGVAFPNSYEQMLAYIAGKNNVVD